MLLGLRSISKETYFDLIKLIDEYVTGLDVSMYYIIWVQIGKALQRLPKDAHYLFLSESLVFSLELCNFLA